MSVVPLSQAFGLNRWEITDDRGQRLAMVYNDGSGLTCSNCTMNDCVHIDSVVRMPRR